jgi:hypothetical protein
MRGVSTLTKNIQISKSSEAIKLTESMMPAKNTYLQNCPVCGRPLMISPEYRGRNLNCLHCGGKFTAIDPASPVFAVQNASSALINRADQLLDLCAQKLHLRVAS